MKAFRFRLESVLTLRAMQESQAREIYGRAVRERHQIEAELAEARTQLDAEARELAEARGEGVRFSPSALAFRWPSLQEQRRACERLEGRRSAALQVEERERHAMLAAKRAHDLLLRLREKQAEEHRLESLKQDELNVADFVNAHRFLRLQH